MNRYHDSTKAPVAVSARYEFTLIELLVVISIVALLIAILLPALHKARASAMSIVCASNMKQLGMGLGMYIGDHKGWMPVKQIKFRGYAAYCWKWSLANYVGADVSNVPGSWSADYLKGAFLCPDWKIKLANTNYGGGTGWNYYIGAAEDHGSRPRRNINQLKLLADTVAMQDSIDWAYEDASGVNDYAYVTIMPPQYSFSTNPKPNVGDRHMKGVNSVWLDLHVTRKSQEELIEGRDGNVDYFYNVK